MTDRRRWQQPTEGGLRSRHPVVLNVPGLGNSGPGHWQSRWEAKYPWFQRVDLGLWDNPDRDTWVLRLDRAILRARGPVILAAHSLGCLAVAWWAALHRPFYRDPVVGALLVAPPDAESAAGAVADFAPVPRLPLPFPSILVASRSDLWACFARSAEIARRWGSHLVDAGEAGHLNAESGHGDWPLGLSLLERLIDASCSIGETMSGLARSSAFASSLASPDPMPKAAG